MASLRYDTRINRSPDDVWKVVSDAGGISAWFPGMEKSSLDGNVRRCELGGGLEIEEEIVTSDSALRRFQYRIVGGALTPEFHLATVDVIDSNGGSLVIYGFDVKPDDLADVMGPAIEAGVAGLKSHLES